MIGDADTRMTMDERAQSQSQLAVHLEQQGESLQAPHRLMKRLEMACLAVPIAVTIAAIAVLAVYAKEETMAIPAALFSIPASFTPFFALLGLHAVIIRGFPPLEFLAGRLSAPRGFYTGRLAVWWGVLVMLTALAAGALWGMGAYAFLSPDILGVLVPCIIGVTIGFAIAAGWLLRQGR